MQSLKAKFGKFAISREVINSIQGGNDVICWCCSGNLCRTDKSTAERLCRLANLPAPLKSLCPS